MSDMSLRIISAVVFILIIIGGFLGYIIFLQMKIFKGLKDEKQLSQFFENPVGLPQGTIRAFLALLIVTISLSLLILQAFGVVNGNFPEILGGILGTILGFYFGSRTSSEKSEGGFKEQIKELKEQKVQVEDDHSKSDKDDLLSKVKKGIAMTQVAKKFLPKDMQEKYDKVVTKLEDGIGTVESIAESGNIKDSLKKATELYDTFKNENPAKNAYIGAVQSFGRILGGNVPAILVVGSVIAITTKLSGVVYQRWKNRILQAPFNAAVTPLKVADANTGMIILKNSPLFSKLFSQELEGNNRPFFDSIAQLADRKMTKDDFWGKYRDKFSSLEEYENGLREISNAANDMELADDIEPSLVSEAGGYQRLMGSIDKIGTSPDAKASLDQLVMITENLQNHGEPVKSIFEKIKSEVPL